MRLRMILMNRFSYGWYLLMNSQGQLNLGAIGNKRAMQFRLASVVYLLEREDLCPSHGNNIY